jgi:4-aminobutyrate aminotransferase-like enzyme/Ser/Thr protein kinase RdoA (MazF antagonist)
MDAPQRCGYYLRMLLEERAGHAVTESEAEQFARELYGLDVSAKALPGEYDDNFHLTTNSIEPPGGADARLEFVLKVMHPARERELIDLQCRALQHLAEKAPQLGLARVRPLSNGETFSSVQDADGVERLVWLLTFVPGCVLAQARPHSKELLQSLGRFLGEMDAALEDFEHPAAHRELKWDLAAAGWIRERLDRIAGGARRALVQKFLELYEGEVAPGLPKLRRSVIYGDANDYNVLVGAALPLPRRVVSAVDFGDMHHSIRVAEVAIGAAYAMFGKTDPLHAAAAVVSGYHNAAPLEEQELAILFPLIAMRLAVSVTNSAQRATLKPDDAYVTISEGPAWAVLERLAEIHPRFAHYTFREACGLAPVPNGAAVLKWMAGHAGTAAPVLDVDVRQDPTIVVDLSAGSAFLAGDPMSLDMSALTDKIFGEMKKARVSVGLGRYDEARLLYSSPLFASPGSRGAEAGAAPGVANGNAMEERRTVHLGIDLFTGPGSAVYAPLDGVVHTVANNAAELDYGPLVILRHETPAGLLFFTLFGHLSKSALTLLRPGQRVARGDKFARLGSRHENGGWPPHLHFQIILDLLEKDADFPGVARASERGVWASLSPDPNLLLRIPTERMPAKEPDAAQTLAARQTLLGPNLSVSYQRPLKMVRGWMQYLYDDTGRAFLDVYNNVPLVGHSHPRVVRAVQDQIALLNTNTRYLHDLVVQYAARLTRLLPDPLRVCYFVNSGSEANELALRMARAHTGRKDVIVLEHAYHGNTGAMVDISPYKFAGPGGRGRRSWVHVAPIADDYRGAYRRGDPEAGVKYAQHVGEIIERLRGENRDVAAYIAESLPSVAGQVVFPPGYLGETYQQVRAAGGVCIADEVQVGFGRLGSHFWGFATQRVVPDIMVLGKPIGNGFPLAAVVTTREIADSFANGMEFFSTFGGNPVACAAGLAVLDAVEEEHLQEKALRVGVSLKNKLTELREKYQLIGDVRGSGLFLGIDLVRNRDTREPATDEAGYAVNRLRECGILAGTDGPGHNVIKLRPPLVFSEADAEFFSTTLESILAEDGAQPLPPSLNQETTDILL